MSALAAKIREHGPEFVKNVLDFKVDKEIKKKFDSAIKEIDDIKKKYKGIAKFG